MHLFRLLGVVVEGGCLFESDFAELAQFDSCFCTCASGRCVKNKHGVKFATVSVLAVFCTDFTGIVKRGVSTA